MIVINLAYSSVKPFIEKFNKLISVVNGETNIDKPKLELPVNNQTQLIQYNRLVPYAESVSNLNDDPVINGILENQKYLLKIGIEQNNSELIELQSKYITEIINIRSGKKNETVK